MSLDTKTRINKTTLDSLALKGYDPVAYFREGRPVEGRKEFAYQWMEATWRFSSAENRDAFARDPEKYTPQYGGYCAWGISQAKFYDGDPLV
jgi:YHS domain-containing protein